MSQPEPLNEFFGWLGITEKHGTHDQSSHSGGASRASSASIKPGDKVRAKPSKADRVAQAQANVDRGVATESAKPKSKRLRKEYDDIQSRLNYINEMPHRANDPMYAKQKRDMEARLRGIAAEDAASR